MIKISRESYEVVILMRAGLGSNRIAAALGVTHAAVLSRQNSLEKLGVISGGTMSGQRRQVLLAGDQFRVEAELRGAVRARARRDREDAARRDALLANLAKARAVKAAKRASEEIAA